VAYLLGGALDGRRCWIENPDDTGRFPLLFWHPIGRSDSYELFPDISKVTDIKNALRMMIACN
jgi:hypothetical protein